MIRSINSLLFILLFLSISCSQKTVGVVLSKLDRKKTSELINCLDSLAINKPNTFYSKISTKYKDTTMQISFKTSVRMVKDSAVSALITYLGIPIYQSIVTKDTISIVDKRGKCYIKTRLEYIKENFGVNFDYENIEELLLGLPIAYDVNQKYFQIHNPHQYIISSHRKREIKRSDKKEKLQDDIIIKYYLNSQLNALEKTEILSKEDSTQILIQYVSKNQIENFTLPDEMQISIYAPKNSIFVEMKYEKIEINQKQEISIVIPEKYEECK